MIEEINLKTIEKINRIYNESDQPWTNWSLLEMTYSSFLYYDDEIEQISSVFKNLNCNHSFSNGNKRTAAAIALLYLEEYGKTLNDKFLRDLCYETLEKHLEVKVIAEKIKNNLIDI